MFIIIPCLYTEVNKMYMVDLSCLSSYPVFIQKWHVGTENVICSQYFHVFTLCVCILFVNKDPVYLCKRYLCCCWQMWICLLTRILCICVYFCCCWQMYICVETSCWDDNHYAEQTTRFRTNVSRSYDIYTQQQWCVS